MALGKNHKVIDDDPGEIVRITRKELNKLLDLFDALVVATTEADFADFATAAALIDTTTLRKVTTSRELPDPPAIQVV